MGSSGASQSLGRILQGDGAIQSGSEGCRIDRLKKRKGPEARIAKPVNQAQRTERIIPLENPTLKLTEVCGLGGGLFGSEECALLRKACVQKVLWQLGMLQCV